MILMYNIEHRSLLRPGVRHIGDMHPLISKINVTKETFSNYYCMQGTSLT